ncbi:MAG: conjugal transfer protein TraT [Gammaproteobacteria bacterium]|nr:conjugal transfer protein TraT [Gammaproteobacteria bacterium]MCP4474802.1 conjugal transfer protein TraT [Gammaproteobacteria bacterium]
MKKHIKYLALSLALMAPLALPGCAAIGTAVSHHDLKVHTKMSNTIFLQPQPNARKTVYVSVHNTSDQQLANIQPLLMQALQAKGYHVVPDVAQASYILQVNVLQIGQVSRTAAQQMGMGSFGSALSGGAVGAVTGAVVTNEAGGALIGGLVGGVATTVADNMVKDVLYTMVTDVQIQQRLARGVTARSHTVSHIQQGTSTSEVVHLSKASDFVAYRTRVMSTADKVNLKFDQAKPLLEQQLAHTLVGLF